MKKIKDSRIVIVCKNTFNVRQWSDYDRLKSLTWFLVSGIKKIFVVQKAAPNTSKNSFSEAVAAQQLSEKALESRKNALYRLSFFMCIIGSILGVYAIYHLVYGHYQAFMTSLIVMMIALVLAFRYHFWYFQIKEQKLGCTIKEWYQKGLLGKSHEKISG